MGGRWNSIDGLPVVYVSDSFALAAWEVFINFDDDAFDLEHMSLTIELPRNSVVTIEDSYGLPDNWNACPFRESSQKIGDRWLKELRSLAMRVPSVVIPESYNYLVNPLHPDFPRAVIGKPAKFEFDPRVFASEKRTPS